jgi:hypothetical protein
MRINFTVWNYISEESVNLNIDQSEQPRKTQKE